MKRSTVAISGDAILGLPAWGRSFWQDPNDGNLVLVYASGNGEANYVSSANSGLTWSSPAFAFHLEDFDVHNNFDTAMDRNGNVHCVHRFNGSGCYTILAKDFIGGLWAPSGVISRGFVGAGDTGPAKGVNASIQITDSQVGPFGDVAGPFPAARIVAKDSSEVVNSYWLPNPFGDFPRLDNIGAISSVNYIAGSAGGFPIFTRNGNAGRSVFYSVDATGILRADNVFGTWRELDLPVDDPLSFSSTGFPGSGYVSRLPLGPAMAFLQAEPYVGPVGSESSTYQTYTLISNKHNSRTNYELLVAANENGLIEGREDSGFSIADVLVSADSLARYNFLGQTNRAPLGLPWRRGSDADSFIRPNNFSTPQASGTLVDLSIGNQPNRINLYFLSHDADGTQNISRIYADISNPYVGGTLGGESVSPQPNRILFSSPSNAVSGIHSWANASRDYTGGSGLFLNWNGFKALRHPTGWLYGDNKDEIVVTAGSGSDGKYRIVSWDYNDSIDATRLLKTPTYSAARTGIITATVGITPSEAQTLIDNDTSTGNAMSPGDSITFDFEQEFRFDRFELAWVDAGSDYYEVALDASLDGTNYTRVLTIPAFYIDFGDTLTKASSEYQAGFADDSITHYLAPFRARHIKVTLGAGAGTRTTREIRFYGASTTAGKWVTDTFSRTFVESPSVTLSNVETFSSTREGSLPNYFTSTGDFDWSVKASGSFGTNNGVISEPSFFQGQSHGNGDGFAARTARSGILSGQSGVLSAAINVDSTEVDFLGNSGRTIQFDMRYHLIGAIPTLDETDPQDDKVYFETITPTGISRVYYPGRFATTASGLCISNICNYFSYRTTVPTGISTLKWVYLRGTTPAPGVVNDEGAVWIDNILGVKASKIPSINGFIKGSAFTASTGPSGVYCFMTKKLITSVNAYTISTESVKSKYVPAYIKSNVLATGTINAYTIGNINTSINAYMLSANEVATGGVNAYVLNSGIFDSIYGYAQNRLNESIYGYVLAPSGNTEYINAYTITPEFSSVNGYLLGPIPINSNINGYVKANGNQDSVYGYIIGSGLPGGTIYGYLLNSGVGSSVNAYLNSGVKDSVNAFIHGAVAQTGSINAWISGIGLSTQSINGYLPAVSGIPSETIYGYLLGAEGIASIINAHIIGFGDDTQCNFALPSLPSFVIPTGNFFI